MENIDISGGGGSFRFPRRDCGTSSVNHATCRLRAVPVLAAKLTDQGGKYGFPPFELESYSIFVTRVCVTFLCHGRERDEIVAQLGNMGYVVHFNTYPSVVGAETYRKVTIPYDRNLLPVCKAERPTTLSVVGETVGVRRHVACCRAISSILHDLLVQRLTPYSIVNRRTARACFGCRERLSFHGEVFFGYR